MPTIANLLSRALRKISSDSPGDTTNSADIAVALDELNSMLDEWSDEDLIIPYRTLENFSLVGLTTSYTIGSGAVFNTSRPDVIRGMYTRDTSGNDFPVTPLTFEEYNNIPLKTNTGRSYKYFYDMQYPNGVIYLYPTPDIAYTLYIDSLKPLAQITDITASISMPGGYQNLIVLNLATRIGPDFGFPLQEMTKLISDAAELKMKVKRRNMKPRIATFDNYIMPRNGRYPYGWNIFNV